MGKEGGGPSVPQERTEAELVARARAGRTVVRLKGGDPFVFGRGGEEALTLRAAGIPFEVVPGVTAGVAASAYAGIPVTHRGLASAVALVTGHEDPTKAETAIDWPALAAFPGTLVLYMGVRRLPDIAAALMAGRTSTGRAGGGGGSGHASHPAHRHGHARDDRRDRPSRGRAGAVDHRGGAGR